MSHRHTYLHSHTYTEANFPVMCVRPPLSSVHPTQAHPYAYLYMCLYTTTYRYPHTYLHTYMYTVIEYLSE